MPALELRGVTYLYPGAAAPALAGIDLRVEAGEVAGIVGANDAGKSTLCLVAAGLAPRSTGGQLDGEVGLDGDAGIVFQDPVSQRSGIAATVFEEVAVGPVNLGWSVPETVAAVREALGAVGIDELAERHPVRLSGGQGQLVSIASAVAMRPQLLVLDEPAAGLDDESTDRVVAALLALAGTGTAMLVAEHRREVLTALGARIIRLVGGRQVPAEGET